MYNRYNNYHVDSPRGNGLMVGRGSGRVWSVNDPAYDIIIIIIIWLNSKVAAAVVSLESALHWLIDIIIIRCSRICCEWQESIISYTRKIPCCS